MQAAPPEKKADFRHVRAWVFDLDNTLYPAHCDLFAQIDDRMTDYVARLLNVDRVEARRLQKEHYRLHGTTLNGLMKVHGIEPEHYLAAVHDIDLSALTADALLAAALARLPGKRFVFTNGCRNHAARVLARLELSHLFDEIWDIRTIEFRPKPDPAAYHAVQARTGTPAEATAMFDDIAHNLVAAHEAGWTTVWLKNGSEWSRQGPRHMIAEPRHIHYETEDLAQFLHTIEI